MSNAPAPDVRYQPIVDLVRREVVGVEAKAAQRPALEVLSEACRQGARWAEQGLRLEITVHLTAQEVLAPGLAEAVRSQLDDAGFAASALLLEVSELSLTDLALVGPALLELAALGVRLGLDEFGMGHSSLVYLRRYPLSALTIDATFVAGLGSSRDDEAIVASIATLAAHLGTRCLADGVENHAQLSRLLPLRCHAQGALFASPVPAGEVAAAIDRAEAVFEQPLPTPSRQRTPRAPLTLEPDVAEHIGRMREEGASLQTIAASLNQAAAAHPLGLRWHARFVGRYVAGDAASRRTSRAR